jgi:hypothetical protein
MSSPAAAPDKKIAKVDELQVSALLASPYSVRAPDDAQSVHGVTPAEEAL